MGETVHLPKLTMLTNLRKWVVEIWLSPGYYSGEHADRQQRVITQLAALTIAVLEVHSFVMEMMMNDAVPETKDVVLDNGFQIEGYPERRWYGYEERRAWVHGAELEHILAAVLEKFPARGEEKNALGQLLACKQGMLKWLSYCALLRTLTLIHI